MPISFHSQAGAEAGLKDQFDKAVCTDTDLRLVSLEGATVVAGGYRSGAGVLDAGGQVRPISLLAWGQRLVFGGPPMVKAAADQLSEGEHLAGRSFYLGHLRPHFGHFLLEGLARLWPLLDGAEYDHFVLVDPFDDSRVKDYQLRVLALFMDVNKLRIVRREKVTCDHLDLPEAGWVFNQRVNTALRPVFAHVRDQIVGAGPVMDRGLLFISRRKWSENLQGNMKVLGEEVLEAAVARGGGTVAFTEDLSWEDQIRLIARHKTVLSYGGSSAHLGLFGPEGQSHWIYRIQPFADYGFQAKLRDDQHYHFVSPANRRPKHWMRLEADPALGAIAVPNYDYIGACLTAAGVLNAPPEPMDMDKLSEAYSALYTAILEEAHAAGRWSPPAAHVRAIRQMFDRLDLD